MTKRNSLASRMVKVSIVGVFGHSVIGKRWKTAEIVEFWLGLSSQRGNEPGALQVRYASSFGKTHARL